MAADRRARFVAELNGPRFRTGNFPIRIAPRDIGIQLRLMITGIDVEFNDTLDATWLETPPTLVHVRPTRSLADDDIATRNLHVAIVTRRQLDREHLAEFREYVCDPTFPASQALTFDVGLEAQQSETHFTTLTVPASEFQVSPSLREFKEALKLELVDIGAAVSRWLWWRCSGLGKFAIVETGMYWSLDGINWLFVPPEMKQVREISNNWQLSEETKKDFAEIRSEYLELSSAWNLYREAWWLSEMHPRSSILIGIAAAEVGFKEWTCRFSPDACWLLETLPSPSLESMIANYMPLLIAETLSLKFKESIHKSLPIREIIKAVTARNTIAHVPGTSSDHTAFEDLVAHHDAQKRAEFLLFVADFLWLLDYLRLQQKGRDATWVWNRIRPESQVAFELQALQ